MRTRTFVSAIIAGSAFIATPAFPADAYTGDHLALQPVDGAGVDCGGVPQLDMRRGTKFWNYDAAATTCIEAVSILEDFFAVQQKYATIGAWDCGINGAAEVDRTGILIRCVGPRGPLNALQVEDPL
jgi:hypothetical protein